VFASVVPLAPIAIMVLDCLVATLCFRLSSRPTGVPSAAPHAA